MESIIAFFVMLFGLNAGDLPQQTDATLLQNREVNTAPIQETLSNRRPDPGKGHGPIIVVDDSPFKPPKQN